MSTTHIKFNEEQKAAMRLIETLVNAGQLVLAPDRWAEGAMRFHQPHQIEATPAIDQSAVKLGKLMIITTPQMLSDAQHTKHTELYQAAADHIGARLLLLDGGATASLECSP